MPTNIGENRIVEDGIVRITEDDANRLGQHRLRAGDIVYSRRGDVEKRALIRKREEGWLCGTGCLKVRLGSGVVDPLFASLFLGHPASREWIVRHAVGATMPNLNTSIMSAVPFALPPLSEQKAIAQILGALDDKIERNAVINHHLPAASSTDSSPDIRRGRRVSRRAPRVRDCCFLTLIWVSIFSTARWNAF